MNARKWIREFTGKEMPCTESFLPAIASYESAYKETCALSKQESVYRKTEDCIDVAWNAEFSLFDGICQEAILIEKMTELLKKWHLQKKVNLAMKQDICKVYHDLSEYQSETEVSGIDNIYDSIRTLKQKQSEYTNIINENQLNEHDIQNLYDIVILQQKLDELNKDLDEFNNLPDDLSEALLLLAKTEAELRQLD
jgi:hypothetical protein